MAGSTLSRLGTASSYDAAIQNLAGRQQNLSKLQEQLTSGKRVVRPSDDPTAAAQAERAITRMERIKADQRALEQQKNSIAMAESTLGDVQLAVQQFRELAVSAGNATYTTAQRQTIANQLVGLRDNILSLANRTDTNGRPLFAALGSALAPFVGPLTTSPDYTFNGLPGQTASSAISIPFALDGDSAFMFNNVRDGVYNAQVTQVTPGAAKLNTSAVTLTNLVAPNGSSYTVTVTGVNTTTTPGTTTITYNVTGTPTAVVGGVGLTAAYPTSTDGGTFTVSAMPGLSMSISGNPAVGDSVQIAPSASLFSVLDHAIRDIGTATTSNYANQAVGQALANIDTGMARLSTVRGVAGDLLNRADSISSNQEKRGIQLEADRSRAEDLDMIQGVSDFQNQQTGYQAALQSYAQVQKLSLFNYIG